MLWTIFTWLLTAISVAGTFLVIRKKVSGFFLWCISNMGWVLIDWSSGLKAQATLFVVYLALSVYGILEWKREAILKNKFVYPSRPWPRIRTWRR